MIWACEKSRSRATTCSQPHAPSPKPGHVGGSGAASAGTCGAGPGRTPLEETEGCERPGPRGQRQLLRQGSQLPIPRVLPRYPLRSRVTVPLVRTGQKRGVQRVVQDAVFNPPCVILNVRFKTKRQRNQEKLGILINVLTVNKEFNPQTTSWNEKEKNKFQALVCLSLSNP